MISEFVQFTKSLFPSIDPYLAEEVKRSLNQFEDRENRYECFLSRPLDYLAQGDIFDDLSFIKVNKKGEMVSGNYKGILLTNTCDAENDDMLVFAPVFPVDRVKIDKETLKKNITYQFLYFPGYKFDEYIVDFGSITTISKELLFKLIEKNEISKLASLNDFGYYLFLSKLTIHFMRPEDTDVQDHRSSQGQ